MMSTAILDVRSIVEILSCLNVGISTDDVVHPKAERVQAIYLAFCNQVLDVPERSLVDLPFECQVSSDTYDMHQKSAPLLLLFTTIRCFVVDFGEANADFTMCDLINPHPRMTRKVLSLLSEYIRFYQTASQVFERTSHEFDSARNAIVECQERVRLAEEHKNALRSEQDSRKRKENELLAERNRKTVAFKELMNQISADEERRSLVIKSIKDGKQTIVNLHSEIASLKNEIEHLAKGIVQSPVRVRRDADEQRALIKRLHYDCDVERKRILDNAESVAIIKQCSTLLDERSRELCRLRDLQAEVNLLEHDLAQCKVVAAEAARHKLHEEEALSRLIRLGQEEAKSHQRASEVHRARMLELTTRKEELSKNLKCLREEAPAVRDEISQLKNEMVDLRNERAKEAETARTNCLELKRRFDELVQNYQRAEEVFEAQSNAFMEAIMCFAKTLDDAESDGGDLGDSIRYVD